MGIRNVIISAFLLCNVTFCSETCDDEIICTTEFVYGLNVTVSDAETNLPVIENITVTITDGDYEEQLMNFEGSDTFIGAGERPGNYTIHVTSEEYEDFTSNPIQVGQDACHVIPESVDIQIIMN